MASLCKGIKVALVCFGWNTGVGGVEGLTISCLSNISYVLSGFIVSVVSGVVCKTSTGGL